MCERKQQRTPLLGSAYTLSHPYDNTAFGKDGRMKHTTGERETKVWIVTPSDQRDWRVWGLTGVERLQRALTAAGVPQERISVGSLATVNQASNAALVIFRADYVFDERLVRGLLESPGAVLFDSSETASPGRVAAVHAPQGARAEALQRFSGEGQVNSTVPETGLYAVTPLELVPAYTSTLRKTDPPYLLSLTFATVSEVEAHLFAASYKGITDVVTKWVWPRPARLVTKWCVSAGISPNLVTLVSWGLVILAAVLFLSGWFGLGLFTAWVMTFLDTVDGKLARVTLTSSKIGHVLDHGLDILHPPFWYLAWGYGLSIDAPWFWLATVVTVGGYVVGRLLEGLFLLIFKMEIHCWRPLDSFFRTITARRNPNLILLSFATLIGRPEVGFVLVAVWTAFCIGFHAVRLLQALLQRWQGLPIYEWQGTQVDNGNRRTPDSHVLDRSESVA
jgi:phosphatidylglycerophosphate synthase